MAEILKIGKDAILGVGDHENDMLLFDAVGFKVAMGNAEDNLKAKADFIAPTVYDDGLAFVIDKFIITNE